MARKAEGLKRCVWGDHVLRAGKLSLEMDPGRQVYARHSYGKKAKVAQAPALTHRCFNGTPIAAIVRGQASVCPGRVGLAC
jgi:hypothetical protein